MKPATQTAPEPTARKLTPLTLPCPRCSEAEAPISVLLSSLGEGEELHCEGCDNRFGIEEVRDMIRRWSPVLAWLDMVPQATEE